MKQKVLMVILDGFSSNYLRRGLCPHLFNIATNHYFTKIEPMFGFQGVGAAIYSSALPNTTGVFTEFILKRNEITAKSQLFRALLRLTDIMPNDELCALTRHALHKMMRKRSPISNVIPSQLFSYFSPKLRTEFTEENSLGNIPTIFDMLRLNNMSYELQKPTTRSETIAINNIINRIHKGTMPDLAVIHPCSLDLIGHNFGPNSLQMQHALKRLDELVYNLAHCIEVSPEKITMIILSDHGMSPVYCRVNLLKMLDQLPISLGKDYLVFLDSTMARFWFFNEKARDLVSEMLNTLNKGHILNKYELKKFGIDKIGQEYGDLIFALKEECVMFPDFFRKYRSPKGMHGYAFPSYDAPILISYAPNALVVLERRKVVRFIDIMPTFLKLFNLKVPCTCEGTSLLN